MTTITQTLETITFTAKAPSKQEPKSVSFRPEWPTNTMTQSNVCAPDCLCKTECPQDCPCRTECPPGCSCKTRSAKTTQMFFYAVGVVISMLAAYLMISTDSKVFLVFWVVYSVLRRMMLKSKRLSKTSEQGNMSQKNKTKAD